MRHGRDDSRRVSPGYFSTKFWLVCAVTTVCGLALLRRYIAGTACTSKIRMDGQTVLITGANTGIGKETARDIAKRGARVLLACRDLARAEQAAADIRQSTGNTDVVVYKLDLASLASVRRCASDVIEKEQRLDVLINNAGVAYTPQWQTEDGFELQFGTNHLGHFLLTNLLLDLLKKSAPSRIINVSSGGHSFIGGLDFEDLNSNKSYSPFLAYFRSKLCNVLFTRELSKRLKASDIAVTANSLHPGVVATELLRYAESDTFNVVLRWAHKLLYYTFVQYMMKTTVEGAQTSIHCAVDAGLDGVTGKYFRECAVSEESEAARDDEAAARLWSVSEHMVGLEERATTAR